MPITPYEGSLFHADLQLGIAGLTNPVEHGETHFYTTTQDWQTQASLHQHLSKGNPKEVSQVSKPPALQGMPHGQNGRVGLVNWRRGPPPPSHAQAANRFEQPHIPPTRLQRGHSHPSVPES